MPQREERGSSGRPLPAARGRGQATRAGRARSRRGARSSRRDYLSFRVRPSWAPARGSRRCGRNACVLQDEWQEISPGASPRGRGSRPARTRTPGSEARGHRVLCGLFLGAALAGPSIQLCKVKVKWNKMAKGFKIKGYRLERVYLGEEKIKAVGNIRSRVSSSVLWYSVVVTCPVQSVHIVCSEPRLQ